MEVILGHEIEEFAKAVSGLIHELRKRYASGDQTLTSLARFEVSQTPTSVPDDYPRGNAFYPYHCLLRHYSPFLYPKDEFSQVVMFPHPNRHPNRSLRKVYGQAQGL